MIRKNLTRFSAAVLAAVMFAPALGVHAAPAVIKESGQEVKEAASVDDEKAAAALETGDKNSELIDPETAAAFLLKNTGEGVLEQVPTDERDNSLPSSYDLRDYGYVTPVNFQNPWGTCWGFSAVAACESSILSAMGKTYDETGLDLSEHHLAYFANTHLADGSSQDGEGVYMTEGFDSLDTGGVTFTACSLFSSGIGPVDEALIPYRGKNSNTESYLFLNLDYSKEDDWTIPADYEFVQAYDLQESNILPSPAVYTFTNPYAVDDMDEREADYVGYDAAATDLMKRELMAGHAISIAFSADQYQPGQLESVSEGRPLYLNTEDNKWTHYTFDGGLPDHAVTIVGWDDSIKSTDFLDHSDDENGDGLAHQPEGDGAWIVKNSWGAGTEDFPNNFDWGITNEDGTATGYFYISYYDRSLSTPETFRFDVADHDNEAYMIDQYDYMQSSEKATFADDRGLQMANVFTAEADAKIKEVSCETGTENESVTYQVYLLDDDAVTPDDGTLAAELNVDYEHAGYHKSKLDTPVEVKKGQRYAVVVTSCFTDGNKIYYDLSSTIADNEAYVEEYNRKVSYRNRDKFLDDYIGELLPYYTVGIVNEGESYVYIGALGQWGDFGDIVPVLQQDEMFATRDFDNFPVKAYLEYDNASDAAAGAAEIMSSDLGYEEPASVLNGEFFAGLLKYFLIGLAVFIAIIIVIVLIAKHAAKTSAKLREAEALKKENEQLRGQLTELTRKMSAERETAGAESIKAETINTENAETPNADNETAGSDSTGVRTDETKNTDTE